MLRAVRRIAPVAVVTLISTLVFVGGQFAVTPQPRVLYELWYSPAPWIAVLVLAFASGFVSARWWALLPALGPLLAALPLQLGGHVTPWHDPTRPLDTAPWVSAAVGLACAIGILVGHARRRPSVAEPRATSVRGL